MAPSDRVGSDIIRCDGGEGPDRYDSDSERLWPDGLELGDRVEFDGDEYEVIGTGPGEATIERVDDDSYRAEVFRWALTNQVGIELETGFSQDEFGELVKPDRNRSGGSS